MVRTNLLSLPLLTSNTLPIRAHSLRRQVQQLKGELARAKLDHEVVNAARRRPRCNLRDEAGRFVLPKIATKRSRPSPRKDEPGDGEEGKSDDIGEKERRSGEDGDRNAATAAAAVEDLNEQKSILPESHQIWGHRSCIGVGYANETKYLSHTFPAPPPFSTLQDAHDFIRALREILSVSTSTATAVAVAVAESATKGGTMDNGNFISRCKTSPKESTCSTEEAPGHGSTGAKQHGPPPTVAVIRNAVRAVLHTHSTEGDKGNSDGDSDDEGVTAGEDGKGDVLDDLETDDKGAERGRRRQQQPCQLERRVDENADDIDELLLNGRVAIGAQKAPGLLVEPSARQPVYHEHPDGTVRLPPAEVHLTEFVVEQSDQNLFRGANCGGGREEKGMVNSSSGVTDGIIARCPWSPKRRARDMSVGGDDDDHDLSRVFETFKRNQGREANLRLQVRTS